LVRILEPTSEGIQGFCGSLDHMAPEIIRQASNPYLADRVRKDGSVRLNRLKKKD
jgi:hypothetical protein